MHPLTRKPAKGSGELSPYCAFRSDKNRLLALISRDVRLVLIALVVAIGAYTMEPRPSQWWSAVLEAGK
jgi:hypothetical protein